MPELTSVSVGAGFCQNDEPECSSQHLREDVSAGRGSPDVPRLVVCGSLWGERLPASEFSMSYQKGT